MVYSAAVCGLVLLYLRRLQPVVVTSVMEVVVGIEGINAIIKQLRKDFADGCISASHCNR